MITVSAFRAKALLSDPAFWVAAFVVVSGIVPDVARWWEDNKILFVPLGTVLAGHFLVRASSAVALGKAASKYGIEGATPSTTHLVAGE